MEAGIGTIHTDHGDTGVGTGRWDRTGIRPQEKRCDLLRVPYLSHLALGIASVGI